jgi:hypothetical protein
MSARRGSKRGFTAETRGPKPEARRKSEGRNPKGPSFRRLPPRPTASAFGPRISAFLRISDFGFRISPAPHGRSITRSLTSRRRFTQRDHVLVHALDVSRRERQLAGLGVLGHPQNRAPARPHVGHSRLGRSPGTHQLYQGALVFVRQLLPPAEQVEHPAAVDRH